VPVEVQGEGRTVHPAAVRVVVEGPASLLRSLQPGDVHPRADVDGLAAGKDAPVTVELSAGHSSLRVKQVVPPSVSVRAARPPRKAR
jgi:hypothetical protein